MTSGKEPACQCSRHKRFEFNPWVRMILWRKKWQPTPLFLSGESHGQRCLAGYSLCGHKELGTTEVTRHAHRHTAVSYWLCPVQFSHSVMSDSLQPHEPQHARPPRPSPTPRVYPNSCPLSRWYHPTISSSVIPFSSCPQSFPALGSFQMSQLFTSGGQSIGVSASTSVLPLNTQDWSPLGWTGWIPLQSKGLSRVLSNTTVQKHQFYWLCDLGQLLNHTEL